MVTRTYYIHIIHKYLRHVNLNFFILFNRIIPVTIESRTSTTIEQFQGSLEDIEDNARGVSSIISKGVDIFLDLFLRHGWIHVWDAAARSSQKEVINGGQGGCKESVSDAKTDAMRPYLEYQSW
jgi:hypothetical protein